MRPFLLTLLLLFLHPHPAADAGDRWWLPVTSSVPDLVYPSVTEIRITPSVPRVAGMPEVASPAPSATVAPRVTPIVSPPPRIEIRRLYLPPSFFRPGWAFDRRPCSTGGWTR